MLLASECCGWPRVGHEAGSRIDIDHPRDAMRGGDQPSRQPVCRWSLLLVVWPGLCGLLSVESVADKRKTERQTDRGARSDGGLVYPLYVYPTKAALAGVYRDVISVASIARVAVIVNPDNGDQAACPPNADWAAANALLRHPNITTLGYVHSAYGKRPLTQVLSCSVCARHTRIMCVCARHALIVCVCVCF